MMDYADLHDLVEEREKELENMEIKMEALEKALKDLRNETEDKDRICEAYLWDQGRTYKEIQQKTTELEDLRLENKAQRMHIELLEKMLKENHV